jgi:N-methylhydantoinase B
MTAAQTNLETIGRERYGLDVASAEVISFALHQVSVQMQQALVRSAFSAVVRDIVDCASSISMRTDNGWETVAETAPTHHAVGSQHVANFVMDEWGPENLHPGDVIFHNDPWRGAVHQSDVSVIRGVFIEDELMFVLETNSHLVDMGGPIPGGYPTGARTIYEESIRVAPSLLYAEDVPVRGLFNLILEDTRVAPLNLGDLRALYGAVVVGERLLKDLCGREGKKRVHSAGLYALDAAEANIRAAIAKVPDGDYTAVDYMDDDGITAEQIRVQATIRIRGDSVECDYSGSERQPAGNNVTGWVESSRGFIPIKNLLDPHSLYNGGAMRAYDAIMPPGSTVFALPPSSVSDHGTIGCRTWSTVLQAMNQAVPPETAVAPDSGQSMFLGLQGLDARPGKGMAPFGTFVLPGIGWGGTSDSDGVSFSSPAMAGGVVRQSVYEHVEREAPVVFWDHAYIIDSAGGGKFRGGAGAYVTIEALSEVEITCVADRIRKGGPGYGGGGHGMSAYVLAVKTGQNGPPLVWNGVTAVEDFEPVFGMIDPQGRPNPHDGSLTQGTRYDVSKFSGLMLQAGEALRVLSGGGGGWGDALERDPRMVLTDVLDEIVSPESARFDYGVVFAVEDDGSVIVDDSATVKQRQRIAEKRASSSDLVAIFRPWPLTHADMAKLMRPVAERIQDLNADPTASEGA